MPSIGNRFRAAWNAFQIRDPTVSYEEYGPPSSYRPDRMQLYAGVEKQIVSAIYTRIAIDVASNTIKHVRLDENGKYVSTIPSGLNDCLSLAANLDQPSRAFIYEAVLSLFDEGDIAIVPIDTDDDPTFTTSYDILSMRTAKITTWYPEHVQVWCYNQKTGLKEYLKLRKDYVAIIENPLGPVMNAANSTLKRLIRKLSGLDAIDIQSGSGKLDLIIQLPFSVRSTARKAQADQRIAELERQMANSKYGIGYIDSTEHITQLNRPAENNLLAQIEYLTPMVYGQLGITQDVLNGTANEQVMINYRNRTIVPILNAIVDAMKCKFLTKTGRTQGQSIVYFKDPFAFVPAESMALLIKGLNEGAILTPNEVRGIFGYEPRSDEGANTLSNKNINPVASSSSGQTGVSTPDFQKET